MTRTIEQEVDAFANEVERRAANLRESGGVMRVSFHGDFANTPPSAVNAMLRHVRNMRTALKERRCGTCERFVADSMGYCDEHGPGGFTPPSADWHCADWRARGKP
jgi:hypothetical protein